MWQRGGWPVIVGAVGDKALKGASDQIVWVRDFGAAAAYAADEGSRVVLEVAEIESA